MSSGRGSQTSPSRKVKVLLADGRKITREGLRVLLEQHGDMRVVGEAEEAQQAVKLAGALAVDVVVMGVALSTRGVSEAVRGVSKGRSGARVIVMPMTAADPAFVREILAAGGLGVLTRDCASDELVKAIRTVAGGQPYLSPRLTSVLVESVVVEPMKGKARLRKALSQREREIVERVTEGRTTKEIAHEMRVSAKTVETYRRRVMEKVGVGSVAELTKYAIREGLTSLDA